MNALVMTRGKTQIFHLLLMLSVCSALLLAGSIQTAGASSDAPGSFSKLADQVKHAVVNISTSKIVEGGDHPFLHPDSPFRDFFGDEFFERFRRGQPKNRMRTNSLGSGIVIDKNGTILTNNHVIAKADEIKIVLDDGKEYDAKVIGRDPKTDLGLIRVEPDENFPEPAVLGDSDAIDVGDWVMAVGNPFGLGHSVTVGIISAKGRIIGAGPYDDFLQTDAAINPGNSGGPLFNMKGEIVGVNTAIVARGQGIGFAIPINLAKSLLPQLEKGKVVRGWLGVAIQNLTPELAKSFGMDDDKGVLIGDILDSGPAGDAGIRRGDVVVEFDGKPVEDVNELSRMVAATEPGTGVEVKVLRDGEPKTIDVVLGTMPTTETAMEETEQEETRWGLAVRNVTPELAQEYRLDEDEKGVVVTSVDPISPAGKARLKAGDLIIEVNRRQIQNLRDYNNALDDAKGDDSLLLLVQRGKRTLYMVLEKD